MDDLESWVFFFGLRFVLFLNFEGVLAASMSNSSRSDGDNNSFDFEELLEIGNRCRELRREKESLRDSQSQSFDLIRKLEIHVKSLSQARTQDRNHIQKLEKELCNCSEEINYLQDQLNLKNAEIYSLGEHVHDLELKLADMQYLKAKVGQLTEELNRSESERFLLLQELEGKEIELQHSALSIEKLEESISMLTLDSQCEIESMRLEIAALDQTRFEAERIQEEAAQEKEQMNRVIKELEIQVCNAEERIHCLAKENKDLRQEVIMSERDSKLVIQKMGKWLDDRYKLQHKSLQNLSEPMSKSNLLDEMSPCEEVLDPLFSKLAVTLSPDSSLKEKVDTMAHQIRDYEALVKQLKEQLRDEKLKAKEEAEDLAQEMAELRYQMTSLLEEECKRRAHIEQVSLHRISKLEAEVMLFSFLCSTRFLIQVRQLLEMIVCLVVIKIQKERGRAVVAVKQ
ncbi:hypothetical protein Tsubulata_009076 [Turnera subulata]|uniref:Uncharacterized protein n=1 Tax=Turnera subulata TaxID=218843 RepID=A0A9Q0G136_9ROSI|nr:hypothetical protein Tsubulata_009076 [Turnera subulata]